jgi:hypothetical protein
MQQRPHRGVERAVHHPVTGVDANVSPIVQPLSVLNYQVSWPRIVRPLTNPPLLDPWEVDSGLPVDPLDKARAVPRFEGRPAPHIGTTDAGLGKPQDILSDLAQICRHYCRR